MTYLLKINVSENQQKFTCVNIFLVLKSQMCCFVQLPTKHNITAMCISSACKCIEGNGRLYQKTKREKNGRRVLRGEI